LGDRPCQLRLIGLQITCCHRRNDMSAAVDLARRSALVGGSIGSDEAVALSDWLVGFSLHLAGDQVQALPYCEVAKRPMRRTSRTDFLSHALDEHRIRARCGLARSLWLCGYHRKGVEEAEKTIQEAIGSGAPVLLCNALLWVAPVFAWHADWTRALRASTELARVAASHSLAPYEAASQGLLGEIQISQGLADDGIRNLRCYIDSISGSYQTATAPAACALAEGLLMIDQTDEALRHVVAALHLARERGGSYWLPELLRVKATIQSRRGNLVDRAESTFLEAAGIAEQQGAISLLLRIARTRAAYYKRRGAYEKAKQSLGSVISRFDEDQDSPALRAAKQQLAALGAYPAGEAA
jgi:tetratricopeptide (TPR) repeat protein